MKQTVIIYQDPREGKIVYDSTGKNRIKALQKMLKSITESHTLLKSYQDEVIKNYYAPMYHFCVSKGNFTSAIGETILKKWRAALQGDEKSLREIFETFSDDLNLESFRYEEEFVKVPK